MPIKRRWLWRRDQAIGPLQRRPARNGHQYSGSRRRILQSPSRSHRGDWVGITGRVPDRRSLWWVRSLRSCPPGRRRHRPLQATWRALTPPFTSRVTKMRRRRPRNTWQLSCRPEKSATQLTRWSRKPGGQALKDDDHRDPVVHLLGVTRQAARAQCEKAVDAFLSSIEKTLQKHVPPHAQGPLISNALSTAFQFQMSVWHMIGEECIRPVRAKHSDWCGLAGIVQAIVETFPKNCALMFPSPPPPPLVASFSSTFRPQSSDDDDGNYDAGSSFRRFDSSLSTSTHGDP